MVLEWRLVIVAERDWMMRFDQEVVVQPWVTVVMADCSEVHAHFKDTLDNACILEAAGAVHELVSHLQH